MTHAGVCIIRHITQHESKKMSISNFENQFSLHRDAKVGEAHLQRVGKDHKQSLIVNVDGKPVTFGHNTAITQAFIGSSDGPKQVVDRLNGGQYFFHKDQLVSYRTGSYNGFVHTDDSISQLIEHVGYTAGEMPRAIRDPRRQTSDKVSLQSKFSTVELDIDAMSVGSDMRNELSFAWDPFHMHVNSILKVVRMVCSNGMVGVRELFNTKIPVISDWLEHMRIANAQIQNKASSIVRQRIGQMGNERASVNDCMRVHDACIARLMNATTQLSHSEIERLQNIALVTDANLHCNANYTTNMIHDSRLSSQIASHLSQLTLWNMTTELATHTTENEQNTNNALTRLANALLFDGDTLARKLNTAQSSSPVVLFDDLDAAFAANLIAQR